MGIVVISVQQYIGLSQDFPIRTEFSILGISYHTLVNEFGEGVHWHWNVLGPTTHWFLRLDRRGPYAKNPLNVIKISSNIQRGSSLLLMKSWKCEVKGKDNRSIRKGYGKFMRYLKALEKRRAVYENVDG